MIKREDLRVRDPFIVTDPKNSCYYLYSNTVTAFGLEKFPLGIVAYKTADLENFEKPVQVFEVAKAAPWADRDVWAPEVHKYGENYYLFVSLKSPDHCRATQIFRSASPLGPFEPISELPQTPADWMSLDGTLHIENGKPYMVFCHEWVQIIDGTMCAVELTPDLSQPVSEPILLFSATDNPLVTRITSKTHGVTGCITDGPFLYTESGKLRMLWSSYHEGRYMTLCAESDGGLFGKWAHLSDFYDFDGGHAMLFTSLDGRRMISLHSPNTAPDERPVFIEF